MSRTVLMTQHAYAEADAHAAASLSDGSVGRALEEGSESFVEARDAALRLLQTAAASNAPAARIQGALALPGAGRGKADRDALAQSLVALSSILRDLGALAAERRSSFARECRLEKAARESPSGVRQRAGPECIRKRRPRARRAASETRARRSSPTGSHFRSRVADERRSLTSVRQCEVLPRRTHLFLSDPRTGTRLRRLR